jgi:MerC mercury resistance protein
MAAPHTHVHETDPSDTVGQVLSAICAVHCVSTPLILLLAPAAGSVLGGAHPLLFLGVVGVALWALIPGYRCHHHREVLVLASVGIGFLGLAAFVFHDAWVVDTGLSLIGAGFMMAAHWRNRRYLRAPHAHHAHA